MSNCSPPVSKMSKKSHLMPNVKNPFCSPRFTLEIYFLFLNEYCIVSQGSGVVDRVVGLESGSRITNQESNAIDKFEKKIIKNCEGDLQGSDVALILKSNRSENVKS